MNTNESVTAFPLQWPIGWPRTTKRERSNYSDARSIAEARDELARQLRLMGATRVIVSSNVPLRGDGVMRSIAGAQPQDTGVAVYFTRKSQGMVLACDKFTTVQDNLWSISQTVDALRRIARGGVSEMLRRAFTGFQALSAPDGAPSTLESAYALLGCSEVASESDVAAAYRQARRAAHPDAGGSHERFILVQEAYAAIARARGWLV